MLAVPAEVVFRQITFNAAKHQKRPTVFIAFTQARTTCCIEGKDFVDFTLLLLSFIMGK